MKRLIINADDLGADEARNAGIFEGIQAGIVTSASILLNGPALEDALKKIHAEPFRNVSWGVHINLSEGKPVATGNSILLGPDGMFKGKGPTQHLLMQEGNPDLEREVAHEINGQISLLKSSGIHLRHLDGHQHVHVFPAVLRAMIRASLKHDIPWIRTVYEPEPMLPDSTLTPSRREEGSFFSALGWTAPIGYIGGRAACPGSLPWTLPKGTTYPSTAGVRIKMAPRWSHRTHGSSG